MANKLALLALGGLLALTGCSSNLISEFKADTDGRESRNSDLAPKALATCVRPYLEKTSSVGDSKPELRMQVFGDRWEAWRLYATNGTRTVYLTEFEPRSENGSTGTLFYSKSFNNIDELRANFLAGMQACKG
ncbi:hypothetical protein [Bordetella sp. BOR01]|uniref:hypothetical protein n=1 Tax=Bordetella sp. BOR01 TaxID=2854779 RepID=UPI001C43CD97|nr:hypothetical protein [Bordetella sp. BOR01]MBV7485809.1 hypothetical protein [Bordetella sp. BOR01]